jgi:hypothetical protein
LIAPHHRFDDAGLEHVMVGIVVLLAGENETWRLRAGPSACLRS